MANKTSTCAECALPVKKRGMCAKHYARWRYHNDPKQRARSKAHSALWNASAPGREATAKARMRLSTGWTPESTKDAQEAQGHRCAICPRWLAEGFCRDHEHVKPPRPRALLCQACNISLGYYEKWQRPAGLLIAEYESYLARFRSPS